jgi:hypothetical protein
MTAGESDGSALIEMPLQSAAYQHCKNTLRAVPVSIHKDLNPGTLASIIRQSQLDRSLSRRRILDRIGAKRRKTAAGSPKGDRSESINKMNRIALKEHVAKSGDIFRAG